MGSALLGLFGSCYPFLRPVEHAVQVLELGLRDSRIRVDLPAKFVKNDQGLDCQGETIVAKKH